MPDMNWAAINRMVFEKLADPEFRRRLVARATDGTRPIVVRLRSDPMSEVVADIARIGGAANVVVPWLNGIVVCTLHAEQVDTSASAPAGGSHLGECTLGVFLERLRLDVGPDDATYVFTFDAPSGDTTQARAELVAVAG